MSIPPNNLPLGGGAVDRSTTRRLRREIATRMVEVATGMARRLDGDVTRRLDKDAAGARIPLPPEITGAYEQQAYAQQLLRESAQANNAGANQGGNFHPLKSKGQVAKSSNSGSAQHPSTQHAPKPANYTPPPPGRHDARQGTDLTAIFDTTGGSRRPRNPFRRPKGDNAQGHGQTHDQAQQDAANAASAQQKQMQAGTGPGYAGNSGGGDQNGSSGPGSPTGKGGKGDGAKGEASYGNKDGRWDPRAGGAGVKWPHHSGILDPHIQSEMLAHQAPQDIPVPLFSPGAPLIPDPNLPPIDGPRQFSYNPAINTATAPRATELTGAAQLRNLALLYDGIQLCETVWFDVVSRLQLRIGFMPNTIPDGESDQDPKWRKIAQPAVDFLSYPDGSLPLGTWLTASIRDVLELGYSPIYFQRNRKGEIIALDLVDAATVKPLLDERGRTPRPPYPAYQQFLYGVPAGLYRADEMYLIRETSRTDSVYPFSRVERIVMRVNQALRKENLDLARFTDSAIPEGMIFPDPNQNWTPEQLTEYESLFNGVLAGNERLRMRIKFGPAGAHFIPTRAAEPHMDFDSYLLNVTVGAFGLSMEEIGMTASSNRSTGQTQQDVVFRRVVEPVANLYRQLFTRIIQERFDQRLMVEWGGILEEEDDFLKARTLSIGVSSGALSPSRMARMMNWPVDLEVPPYLMTKNGPVWLEDALFLREAQLKAMQMALQFPVGIPGQKGQQEEDLATLQAQHAAQDAAAKQKAAQTKAGAQMQDGGDNGNASGLMDTTENGPPPPGVPGASQGSPEGRPPAQPQGQPQGQPPAEQQPAQPGAPVTVAPPSGGHPPVTVHHTTDEEGKPQTHVVVGAPASPSAPPADREEEEEDVTKPGIPTGTITESPYALPPRKSHHPTKGYGKKGRPPKSAQQGAVNQGNPNAAEDDGRDRAPAPIGNEEPEIERTHAGGATTALSAQAWSVFEAVGLR